jgi:hypothetical protein
MSECGSLVFRLSKNGTWLLTISLKANSLCAMCMSISCIRLEVLVIGALISVCFVRQGRQQHLRACHAKQDPFLLSQVG